MKENPQTKKSKKVDLGKDSHIEQLLRERNDLNKTLSKLLKKIKNSPRT